MTFFEKVTLDVGGSTLSVYKLNVQILSQSSFKKKGSYNSTSLQGKTTMSDDFELGGEDEMKPTSRVTFSASLRITWSLGRASKTGEHLCVYKAYTCIEFF